MKLGLIGLPQAGKRTLFKLLTNQLGVSGIQAIAPVHDNRFDRLVNLYKPARETPAVLDLVLLPDIATDSRSNTEALESLVNVDVILFVVRAFHDDTIFHPHGNVNPVRDARIFADELLLNDLLFVDKRQTRLTREKGKISDSRRSMELDLLPRLQQHLYNNRPLSGFAFSDEEKELISSYPLLTRKQWVIAINVDERQIQDPPKALGLHAEFSSWNCDMLCISARIEEELTLIEGCERKAFLDDLGVHETALDRLTRLCYTALGLISFFTVGADEVRAWTVLRGAIASEAGGAIHSDIERGFIRVEVMRCEDLLELGSEQAVKEAGKLQQKGRDYTTVDGDIMHFLFKV